MDSIAFQTWLNDFGSKFPAIREWFRAMKPAEQDALFNSWQQAMEGLDAEDCLEANLLMLCGELEGPGDWPAHWQGVPRLLRSNVAEVRALHAEPGAISERDEYEHKRNLFVRDREKGGMPREQIDRELVAAGYEGIAFGSYRKSS